MVKPAKNTICLWMINDAEDAARFYAKTFPDSSVVADRAPETFRRGRGHRVDRRIYSDGRPCLGLNGGPAFKHNRSVLVSGRNGSQPKLIATCNPDRRQRRPRRRVRLVQEQVGIVLADHSNRPDKCDHRSRSRGRQARFRCHDARGRSTLLHSRPHAAVETAFSCFRPAESIPSTHVTLAQITADSIKRRHS